MNERLIEIAYASMPTRPEWIAIRAAEHPRNGEWGMVVRNIRTGIYAMDALGSMRSVPQSWARGLDRTPEA